MRDLFCFTIGLLLLCSCERLFYNQGYSNDSFSPPAIIDSSDFVGQPISVIWKAQWRYNILYIGKYNDPIVINGIRPDQSIYRPPCFNSNRCTEIEIFVDTSNIINVWNSLSYGKDEFNNRVVLGFPIWIRNNSSSPCDIGYSQMVKLKMEAIDEEGQWQPIEEIYKIACSTGESISSFSLEESLLTTAPLYQGSYKTLLKIKYLNSYSNFWTGNISPCQFERDPNGIHTADPPERI